MANPYITNVDPYFSQQDLSGYAPILQDDSKQKLMQAAALAQQNQQVSEAGQQQGSGMSGLNPLAMAMMLRKKPEEKPTYKGPSYGTNPNFDNSHFDVMSYD